MLKIRLYSGDSSDTSGSNFGYAVYKKCPSGEMTFDFMLSGLKPDTKYDIWVKQYPAIKLLTEPMATVTTDVKGKGSASVSVARMEGKTGFWLSLTSGKDVFRSVAVKFD
jgi:hypothetical protein